MKDPYEEESQSDLEQEINEKGKLEEDTEKTIDNNEDPVDKEIILRNMTNIEVVTTEKETEDFIYPDKLSEEPTTDETIDDETVEPSDDEEDGFVALNPSQLQLQDSPSTEDLLSSPSTEIPASPSPSESSSQFLMSLPSPTPFASLETDNLEPETKRTPPPPPAEQYFTIGYFKPVERYYWKRT